MRDLLWLIVVVALSVLWWTDRQKVTNLERELTKSRQEKEFAQSQAEQRLLALKRSQLVAAEMIAQAQQRYAETFRKLEGTQDSDHASE